MRVLSRAEVENAPQPSTPKKKPTDGATPAPAPADEPDVDVAAEYEPLPPVTPSKQRTNCESSGHQK